MHQELILFSVNGLVDATAARKIVRPEPKTYDEWISRVLGLILACFESSD